MSNSLLDKALAFSPSRRAKIPNTEMIPLALAWMRGDITLSQVAAARDTTPAGSISAICTALRAAYEQGLLRIVKEAEK